MEERERSKKRNERDKLRERSKKRNGERLVTNSVINRVKFLVYRNSLSVDDNICSPMGVELSGEGIAGSR